VALTKNDGEHEISGHLLAELVSLIAEDL